MNTPNARRKAARSHGNALMTEIAMTKAERASLYFIPQAPGDKMVPEEIQQRLQDLGLTTAPREDGQRRLTVLGDKARLGTVPVGIMD